jgi:hypothetical protein
MSNSTTTPPTAEKYNPIILSLPPNIQKDILRKLDALQKEQSKFNLSLKRSIRECVISFSSRCKILDAIKEATKFKYEQLSEITGISVPYLKTFAQLSKAINNANERSIDEFILINEERILSQKEPKFSIHNLTAYLKGTDIFSNVISDEDEGKEQKKGAKEQSKGAKETKQSKAKEQTSEPKVDANKQTFVFNPLLFGFEAKEDVMLSITHSPKNTAKPYLIVSSINSALLRSMFDKICFELGRCERDLEEAEKTQNKSKQAAIQDILETETELADDITLDAFDSEFMQVRK